MYDDDQLRTFVLTRVINFLFHLVDDYEQEIGISEGFNHNTCIPISCILRFASNLLALEFLLTIVVFL